ncbi:hypothetical protein AB6C54_22745 [Vibrio splendidus]
MSKHRILGVKKAANYQTKQISRYFGIKRAYAYRLLAKLYGFATWSKALNALDTGKLTKNQSLRMGLLSKNKADYDQYLLSNSSKLAEICACTHSCIYKPKRELAEFILRQVFKVDTLFPQQSHTRRSLKFNTKQLPFLHHSGWFVMNGLKYKLVAIPVIRTKDKQFQYKYTNPTADIRVLNQWLSKVDEGAETVRLHDEDNVIFGWPVSEFESQGLITCSNMLGLKQSTLEYTTIERRPCDYAEVIEFEEFELLLRVINQQECGRFIPPFFPYYIDNCNLFVSVQPMRENIRIHRRAFKKVAYKKPRGNLLHVSGSRNSLKWLVIKIFDSLENGSLIGSLSLNQICAESGYKIAKGLVESQFVMYYPSIPLNNGWYSSDYHSLITSASWSSKNQTINGTITISESAVRIVASVGKEQVLRMIDSKPATFVHKYDATRYQNFGVNKTH